MYKFSCDPEAGLKSLWLFSQIYHLDAYNSLQGIRTYELSINLEFSFAVLQENRNLLMFKIREGLFSFSAFLTRSVFSCSRL